MTRHAVILFATVLAILGSKSRGDTAPGSEHIHWSSQTTLRSPDGKWLLFVRPTHANDDPADVYISRIGGEMHPLFQLRRDAEIYWRSQFDQLVILDEVTGDDYRLMVFHLDDPSERSALSLNSQISRDIRRRLSKNDQIVYYFPHFSGWTDNDDLVISVGVMTAHRGSGSFTSHCFGYVADGNLLQIKTRLSEATLKAKYGESCQMWP